MAIARVLVVNRLEGVREGVVADEDVRIGLSHLVLRSCESFVSIYDEWGAALTDDDGKASRD